MRGAFDSRRRALEIASTMRAFSLPSVGYGTVHYYAECREELSLFSLRAVTKVSQAEAYRTLLTRYCETRFH